MNKPIYFIFCYARSGGTFFNRYLAGFEEFIILSEVHPIHNTKGGIYSVKEQMKKWYNIEIKSDNYLEQIKEVKSWCDENNKYLIIRDWSYIDFAKSYLNKFTPAKSSTNLKLLEKEFDVNKIIFVRNAIDIFLSQGKNIKIFSAEYLSYIKYITSLNLPIFKYEEFVNNPSEEFKKICKSFNILELNQENKKDVSSKNVIGDINISRGNQSSKIVKLRRRYAGFFKRKTIDNNIDLKESNALLSYPTTYDSEDKEDFLDFLKFEIKILPNKIKVFIHKNIKKANKD